MNTGVHVSVYSLLSILLGIYMRIFHTIHGVLKARILKWFAVPFSSGPRFVPIAKFRLKLKKVGKTTRPFRYDLNQIPYDYTVKVTNRFKGLDLIECLKNYGQRFVTLYRRQ